MIIFRRRGICRDIYYNILRKMDSLTHEDFYMYGSCLGNTVMIRLSILNNFSRYVHLQAFYIACESDQVDSVKNILPVFDPSLDEIGEGLAIAETYRHFNVINHILREYENKPINWAIPLETAVRITSASATRFYIQKMDDIENKKDILEYIYTKYRFQWLSFICDNDDMAELKYVLEYIKKIYAYDYDDFIIDMAIQLSNKKLPDVFMWCVQYLIHLDKFNALYEVLEKAMDHNNTHNCEYIMDNIPKGMVKAWAEKSKNYLLRKRRMNRRNNDILRNYRYESYSDMVSKKWTTHTEW